MKPKDPRIRVGVTLTAFTVLLFALVFSLDTARSWWSSYRTFTVVFANVEGLRPNDPVQFHGIPCGRVLSVQVIAPDSGKAYASRSSEPGPLQVALEVQVPDSIFRHLRTGSIATINKTLTGVTVVRLDQGEGEALPMGGTVVGKENATFDAVTNQLMQASERLNHILEHVEPLIARVHEEGIVNSTLAEFEGAAAEARKLATSMRGMVEDNRESIRATTEIAREFLTNLDSALPALVDFVDEATITASKSTRLIHDLQCWLTECSPELSATVENIGKASAHLKALSAELRRRPWRLLHAPTAAEAKELGIYDTATAYAEGAVELRRSIDLVRRALQEDPSPEAEAQMNEALELLETRLSRLSVFEDAFWEKLKSLYQ